MTLIDNILIDRALGTSGPWQISGVEQHAGTWYGYAVGPEGYRITLVAYADEHDASMADTRRIARIPEKEAALLVADELADAVTTLLEATIGEDAQEATYRLEEARDRFHKAIGEGDAE